MKIKARTENRNFWQYVLDWLDSAVKIWWRKLMIKGKSGEPFPNEGPH